MAQSLVGLLLLYPGAHKALFVPSQSLFSQTFLWKFCNQIPLAFKVKFPGGSQFLSRIPRLGNLWCTLELLQQCENFFCIIVLQFVGCLLGGSTMWLMVTSSKRTYTTHHASQSFAARTPVLTLFTSN